MVIVVKKTFKKHLTEKKCYTAKIEFVVLRHLKKYLKIYKTIFIFQRKEGLMFMFMNKLSTQRNKIN